MAVRLQIIAGRKLGDSDSQIRQDIKAAFDKSINGPADYLVPVQTPSGEVRNCVDRAGMFRTVYKIHHLDRTDLQAQEVWWAIVESAMNQGLSTPTDSTRRGA